MALQAHRNGKKSGEATNYEILSVTMVEQRRKFISNRLKRLEKLNICGKAGNVNFNHK